MGKKKPKKKVGRLVRKRADQVLVSKKELESLRLSNESRIVEQEEKGLDMDTQLEISAFKHIKL